MKYAKPRMERGFTSTYQLALTNHTHGEYIMDVGAKREREKKVVAEMVALYCRGVHGTGREGMCPQCAELAAYAASRSDRCPFMETKTFCSNCKVHCYSPEMRERIRAVMRYSGPRMIFHHPVMAVRHAVSSLAEKRRIAKEEGKR